MSETIVLCSDLIFGMKITGTAETLQIPVKRATSFKQASGLITESTSHLIVDLDEPVAGDSLKWLIETLPADAKSTAYGPHVNVARLKEARTAGFTTVLPRSEFASRLEQILIGDT